MTATTTRRHLPILMAPDLAQKVFLGTKTMHRVPLKPQPDTSPLGSINGFHLLKDGWHGYVSGFRAAGPFVAPYRPGDLLYVRETFCVATPNPNRPQIPGVHYVGGSGFDGFAVMYRGEGDFRPIDIDDGFRWSPSIHMPKWAARTWLEVLSVRAERVQEITETDLMNEGYSGLSVMQGLLSERRSEAFRTFAANWNARYPGSWDRNDWVFAYGFKKVEAPR